MSKDQPSTVGPRVARKRSTVAAPKRSVRLSLKSGPGRPTAERIEAINRAILAVAAAEFLRSGYAGTEMEGVAKAAGVSKRTLYDRYPNKQALLKAVVTERVASWSEEWAGDDGAQSMDLRKRLKQRARRTMEYCCSEEFEQVERFFSSSPSMDELRRMRYEVGHKRVAHAIAKEIIELTHDQIIELQTALRLAEMLLSMLHGWWLAHLGVRSIALKEAQTYADHAVDVLLDGRAAWCRTK